MGWDVITFVTREHMVDATQYMGLGWDVTWLMLRNTWGWGGM